MFLAGPVILALIGVPAAVPLLPLPPKAGSCSLTTVWRHAEPSAARLARAVPEYAGAYARLDSLTVFLTDTAARESIRAALRAEFDSDWSRRALPNARFVTVRHSYRELQSWLECIVDKIQGGDLLSIHLNPVANKVILEASDTSSQRRLAQLIAELGIPASAFTFYRQLPNEELNLTGGLRQQLARRARELPSIGSAGRLTPAR